MNFTPISYEEAPNRGRKSYEEDLVDLMVQRYGSQPCSSAHWELPNRCGLSQTHVSACVGSTCICTHTTNVDFGLIREGAHYLSNCLVGVCAYNPTLIYNIFKNVENFLSPLRPRQKKISQNKNKRIWWNLFWNALSFVEMESPQLIYLIDKHVLKWLDNLRWTWPSGFFFFFFFFWNEFFIILPKRGIIHP